MVYVNSKKYACESCIKGHRSSSCHHNDRPLFEIKKKGRPVSQCEKCREARQARRIHAKCTCETERHANTNSVSGDGVKKKKGKRFIPTVPSLPNGLRDALKASSSPSSETKVPKRPVDSLLNPCHCKDVYNCKCRPQVGDSSISLETRPRKPVDPAVFSDGLSALALVAACCSPATTSVLPPSGSAFRSQTTQVASLEKSVIGAYAVAALSLHDKDNSEPRSPGTSKRKRSPRSSPVPESDLPDVNKSRSRAFRPIAPASPEMHKSSQPAPIRPYAGTSALPSIPVLSSTTSRTASVEALSARDMDSSHCCCGTRCECAGCQIHSLSVTPQPSWVDDPAEAGPSTSAGTPVHGHSANCAEGCPTCVDYEGGVELPPVSNMPGVPPPSTSQAPAPGSAPPFLAAFLARAASLPAPPAYARSSLDPTNVTVYPAGLFNRPRETNESAGTREDDERPRAFGLVRIPKLEECCGGRCGCDEDACGCNDKCDGCCMGGEVDDDLKESAIAARLSPSISFARASEEAVPNLLPISPPNVAAAKSCCARP